MLLGTLVRDQNQVGRLTGGFDAANRGETNDKITYERPLSGFHPP